MYWSLTSTTRVRGRHRMTCCRCSQAAGAGPVKPSGAIACPASASCEQTQFGDAGQARRRPSTSPTGREGANMNSSLQRISPPTTSANSPRTVLRRRRPGAATLIALLKVVPPAPVQSRLRSVPIPAAPRSPDSSGR